MGSEGLVKSRMKRTWLLFCLGLLWVVACKSETVPTINVETDVKLRNAATQLTPNQINDAILGNPYFLVGNGVAKRELNGASGVAFIFYGGWQASLGAVQDLVDEYLRSTQRLPRAAYAVQGPKDSNYASREIANSSVVSDLLAASPALGRLVIVGHSSGTYVARELLDLLDSRGMPSGLEIDFYNLDGGQVVNQLALKPNNYFAVYARGASGSESFYAQAMRSEAQAAKNLGINASTIGIDASGSGCQVGSTGGRWCLHDAVIITRPHNSDRFDLAKDYTQFSAERRLVVLPPLRNSLSLDNPQSTQPNQVSTPIQQQPFDQTGLPGASNPTSADNTNSNLPSNDQTSDQQSVAVRFITVGGQDTWLKSTTASPSSLQSPPGSGQPGPNICRLSAGLSYLLSEESIREGVHCKIRLANPIPGCALKTGGYVYLPQLQNNGGCRTPPTTSSSVQNASFSNDNEASNSQQLQPVASNTPPQNTIIQDTWMWPLSGRVSSEFGPRNGGFHRGIDIARESGALIRAARSGTVTANTWDSAGCGHFVRIDHSGNESSTYCHMLNKPPYSNGKKMLRGTEVGKVGSTGFSTGPHLHLMIKQNGQAVNPRDVIAGDP